MRHLSGDFFRTFEFGVRFSDRIKQHDLTEFYEWPLIGSLPASALSNYTVSGFNVPPVLIGNFDQLAKLAYGGFSQSNANVENTVDPRTNYWRVHEYDYEEYLKTTFHGDVDGHGIRGNAGIRFVTVQTGSLGYQVVNSSAPEEINLSHSYSDILPSLNLTYDFTKDLLLRFGAARVMSRPPLDEMRAGRTIYNTTPPPSGTAGNPVLNPFLANQIDASLEWYFHKEGLLAASVYYKDVDSNIGYKTQPVLINGVSYDITGPFNGKGGTMDGVEFTFQTPFYWVPVFEHFGIYSNLALGQSTIKEFSPVNNPLPQVGFAKTTAEVDLWYNQAGFEARLGYKYHSPFTVIYGWDASQLTRLEFEGILDFSASYQINPHYSVRFQASNLTDTVSRYDLEQRPEPDRPLRPVRAADAAGLHDEVLILPVSLLRGAPRRPLLGGPLLFWRNSVRRALCLIAASALALAAPVRAADFYFGADLSYVNEMEDCGAKYRVNGQPDDPFHIFATHGTNLVRVRLWMNSDWTKYSNLADVKKTIARAKAQGMQVLLDFHYSDTWADGDKQPAPKAWADIKDPKVLADALYKYTFDTLTELAHDGLEPQLVQVGNETNVDMVGGKKGQPIDWTRNALLFNAGIKAVRDAGAGWKVQPRVMIHIAQPENAEPWFAAAKAAGVTDFDMIGLSYYSKWSKETIAGLGATVNRLHRRYRVDVLVAETAYPWTLDFADTMPNLLGEDLLLKGYPATPDGQARYLVDLTQTVIANGGDGVIYWEPAWVSTGCRTPWGVGSSWENATFFDFHKADELLPAIGFQQHQYVQPVAVAFRFDLQGPQPERLYLWGDFLGARDMIIPLKSDGQGHWSYTTRLMPGQAVRFQVYDRLPVSQGLLPGDKGTVGATVGDKDFVVEATIKRS